MSEISSWTLGHVSFPISLVLPLTALLRNYKFCYKFTGSELNRLIGQCSFAMEKTVCSKMVTKLAISLHMKFACYFLFVKIPLRSDENKETLYF